MHDDTFALIVLALAKYHPEPYVKQLHRYLFSSRSADTSLMDAIAEARAAGWDDYVTESLAKHPALLSSILRQARRSTVPQPQPQPQPNTIEVVQDTGRRRPSVFPGRGINWDTI